MQILKIWLSFVVFLKKVGLSGFIVDKRITLNSTVCIRMLNYSAIKYDGDNDPAPLFFNKEIQSLLKVLTRVDLAKVFKKKRLNDKKLEDPRI
ncbi:hypothetical protein NQ317_000471 [Molorchus minor]|uniref:Uncharacterized protein n=1 Tax=Molorchus minor TaxID=1323400 RepID=A0ABQ9IUV0_9CUCU|nr:hypothetical protein NQ317_000471 [Molorchus minor]